MKPETIRLKCVSKVENFYVGQVTLKQETGAKQPGPDTIPSVSAVIQYKNSNEATKYEIGKIYSITIKKE